MAFSKHDLEAIKLKLPLSTEIEKKTKIIKKGKDSWCCCLFHEEKTPSFKINDDLGSFYCFGCGAKGDIFTIYTDLYNYTFFDAVKELSQNAGVNIDFKEYQISDKQNNLYKILELSTQWFQNNLQKDLNGSCNKYLKYRKLNTETIEHFRLGYSYNHESSLYNYLKSHSFEDNELLESNVVKYDNKNNIKDFFYKRLIFPITNLQGKVVGFGGRVLDDSNPKYINSPESSFFQKRYLLYNLKSAKDIARKKNNLLICEGYMDVITLHQFGIKSIVAPLGTALTQDQLTLAWRYSNKPTIMFDGDNAGIRASYKAAILSLPILAPKRFLQFIVLPNNLDPDSYLNTYSFSKLLNLLKKPISLIDFVFNESSKTIQLDKADDKIMLDKYLDDIVETINDKKIQYFYRNELKSLFFEKLKGLKNIKNNNLPLSNPSSILEKQILSFIASIINHPNSREDILIFLKQANFLDKKYEKLIIYLDNALIDKQTSEQIINNCEDNNCKKILNKSLGSNIIQLFPFASPQYDGLQAKYEIQDSIKNLNTRLLNLKKINKSLDTFANDANPLNWEELQRISQGIQGNKEKE